MKKFICLAAVLTLTACNESSENTDVSVQNSTNKVQPSAHASTELFIQYKQSAQELVTLIDQQASNEDLENSSKALVALSQPIIQAFKVKFPQCNDYLNAVSAAADIIPSLPLTEIESGYHADGKLPAITDVNCYHAKDLLVHPATVQAMAAIGIENDSQRQQAKDEVVEVIEHFAQVESAYQG
ncbi:hypothetical protein GCM10009111_18840 [Colwellia asteriadis]|uniref:Lipoprotein n=1 Tax=Colwellia asteriadis TaxID=517723 RepID=A0ABN1L7Q2_9GAMM